MQTGFSGTLQGSFYKKDNRNPAAQISLARDSPQNWKEFVSFFIVEGIERKLRIEQPS